MPHVSLPPPLAFCLEVPSTELFCRHRTSSFMSPTAGVVLSMLRFGPKLALTGLQAPTLTAPFAKVVDQVVTDPWLRKFLDLECFVLR